LATKAKGSRNKAPQENFSENFSENFFEFQTKNQKRQMKIYPHTMPDHSELPLPENPLEACFLLFVAQKLGNGFQYGRLHRTPGAEQTFSNPFLVQCIARHIAGDWGILEEEDIQANHAALETGDRVFSAYTNEVGEKLYVITEADRSVTTALLPEEY